MVQDPLEALLASLELPAPPASDVAIEGEDPVLPTRLRIGEAAATALAGLGCAIDDLWQLRTGRRQSVRVDVRAAAASLLSFLLTRVTDRDGPGFGDRAIITDAFRARGGDWFFLHGSFPPSQERALELLRSDATPEGVARAVAGWDAQSLEDAFAEHGLCGARVRSAAEWRGSEQGIALAGHPPVEVVRIGDSHPERLSGNATAPLSGARALDLTRVLAGPTCGRTLAQHGADVLRIGAPHLPSIAQFVLDTSPGKRSAFLDLSRREDADQLRVLLRSADVFTQGYRSGAIDRLGFGPEAVAALRPGIVYVSINCYGHVGPWAGRPGWEQLAQTVTGISHENGHHAGSGGPKLLPAAATDYTTGYLAALGVAVALRRRALEGGSWWVRASLSRTAMWIQSFERCEKDGAGLDRGWLAPLLQTTQTPFGLVEHLAPVLQLSETPARWTRPASPLGTHAPDWNE